MARILIIDDDAALREVVRISLESVHHEVVEAADGKEGVELALRQLPDLILCDVRMEHMDGYDTLSALRQNTVTTSIPVILMTGQADAEGMRQGMELGADDYLPKPFKLDQLTGAVGARLQADSYYPGNLTFYFLFVLDSASDEVSQIIVEVPRDLYNKKQHGELMALVSQKVLYQLEKRKHNVSVTNKG